MKISSPAYHLTLSFLFFLPTPDPFSSSLSRFLSFFSRPISAPSSFLLHGQPAMSHHHHHTQKLQPWPLQTAMDTRAPQPPLVTTATPPFMSEPPPLLSLLVDPLLPLHEMPPLATITIGYEGRKRLAVKLKNRRKRADVENKDVIGLKLQFRKKLVKAMKNFRWSLTFVRVGEKNLKKCG
ncbi:uncharacterized protein LOC130727693 isoform X5 [Lotus japonicus]|uniref:uncharacterized protein LOC130727693 isoform X5 n=1 Tax=Lotus japonicus TaxID=34305 RepID=UPI002587CDB0|nr:uncharacterized protein LOC130727693 isoform X5 [Lotus japonicus]